MSLDRSTEFSCFIESTGSSSVTTATSKPVAGTWIVETHSISSVFECTTLLVIEAESVGFTPTPLENFERVVINDSYSGSMYEWTKDERVKGFHDTIEVFHPTKSVQMHVEASWGEELDFDSCIVDDVGTYIAYLYGDHPFITITVPDNPQDRVCLVLKDSFGNAFVPFLCEHYGTILVVDPRFFEGVLTDRLWAYNLTDIIFVNNVEAANSIAWPKLFMGCVGVTLP